MYRLEVAQSYVVLDKGFPHVIDYPKAVYRIDGYFMSYIINVLNTSLVYRKHLSKIRTFNIHLKEPTRHFMDRIGNGVVIAVLNERIENGHALSWLSTLGGAFSALGDMSQSFALEAGRISVTQLQVALMMGDPLIASRCRLYAAISLLQQGYLRFARRIVLREFTYAKSLPPEVDPKLIRMCLGIWEKLRYTYSQRKQLRSGLICGFVPLAQFIDC